MYKGVDGYIIGEVLSKDIYDSKGILLLAKDTIINRYMLERIREHSIREIYIYDAIKYEGKSQDKVRELKIAYKKSIYEVKNILRELAVEGKLNVDLMKSLSDSIYEQSQNSEFVINCMHNLKLSDEYTYTHSINVGIYSLLMAKWLSFSELQRKELIAASILHDVGKMKIPNEILNKKDKLTSDEFEIIKKHTTYGYEIIKDMPELNEEIKLSVLMHHEREDGSGYPLGKKGAELGIYSKIIAVADVYDALTSERAYKGKMTPFDTFKEMARNGLGHFDTELLLIFLNNIADYYIGAKVLLNTGEIGEVVFVSQTNDFNPIIKIEDRVINLKNQKEYTIREMI